MKGACFADVATIQECLTAVLLSIPKQAFTDSFQKLYERSVHKASVCCEGWLF
jgi:hypothetical protein